MESVIPEDSPLAGYLEGRADAASPPSPRDASPPRFAPRGLPGRTRLSRLRDRIPPLSFPQNDCPSVASIKRKSRAYSLMPDQLIGPSSEGFLDRFRYMIITSQLLNSRANTHTSQTTRSLLQPSADGATLVENPASHTVTGLLGTGFVAFILAWTVHKLRNVALRQTQSWQVVLVFLAGTCLVIIAYYLLEGQWLAYVRKRLIPLTSSYSSRALAFDSAAGAAVSLIQEVELVSRGYRISTPLPPVSRLEDQGQIKRCVRLRRALKRGSTALLATYVQSFESIQPFAIQADFERYCDVYEITRSDIDEISALATLDGDEDAADSLKSLQLVLRHLHLARKAFLCSLLALSTGKNTELSQWNAVAESMRKLTNHSYDSAMTVDGILAEESKPSAPATPKEVLSPAHERLRTQLRKFTTLSQGIRELQAKIFLLREESDQALGSSEDVTEVGSRLLEQYDSFGADLRNLVQEWEEGRRALSSNIIKHENRASFSPPGLSISRSTTPGSLGGRTVVSGSPAEALKILNGEIPHSLNADSSDEELFEAVALPRPRSMLTREERIFKMKDERLQQALARERHDAGRHLVKELESVIRLRPHLKGARTSL